ncbi:Hypothetical predicted protein [Olea europaea subsp. europaea]|uniref:Uncharacterized protein n=1 Tax=Olea europaea subsp. europaea TaxID=158383 RepID=A0A8S0SE95_OLEEU|nr:Hypothetical predicted protein [Olea europaea subsp. europaea]
MGRELTGRVYDLSHDVGILQSSIVDLQDTVAAFRGDLAGRRWGTEGMAEIMRVAEMVMERGVTHIFGVMRHWSNCGCLCRGGPDGDREGTTEGVALTGVVEEVAMEGEALTGGAEVVATEGEAPMGGAEEVAPEVERTPGVIEGKRHTVDETEQVVGKRLRVPSQYVVSPLHG